MSRRSRLLVVPLLAALLIAGCGEQTTTQVLTIARPLPQREQTRYRVLNDKGDQIGSAVLSIGAEGDDLRLGLDYDFGSEQKDTSIVIVRRDSMRPVRSERTVLDGARRYVTRAEYSSDKVVVTLDDGGKGRRSEAKLTESAYDNLESLFLWRTLEQSVGSEVRFGNIIVDPRRGNISRAVATVETVGRGNVELTSGQEPAWRVQFRSAGVTNTAWYRADDSRILLKYQITRGPTLVLESGGR